MSRTTTLTPVKIAQWGHDHMMYLPLYAAIHGGFAQKIGLDITLVPMGNDDKIFQAVATGKADFGFGDPVFVEIGKQRGIHATCLAVLVKRAAVWGITHNPAIPLLEHIADFVQLRIGSFPRPSTVYSLIEGLKQKHKRLLKYMQLVEAPIGEQTNMLIGNKADIVMQLEPMVSLAEANGMRAVFSLAQFYGDMTFTGLMALDKTIEQKPDIAERLVKALQQGLDICLNNPKKALAIAQIIFPDYPAAILERSIKRMKSQGVWPKITAIDPKAWQAAVALRRKIGDLK